MVDGYYEWFLICNIIFVCRSLVVIVKVFCVFFSLHTAMVFQVIIRLLNFRT